MEYNIHKYDFISVWSHENKKCCVFVTLDWALYIYIGGGSSDMEATILHRHVSTVAQNGQTALERTRF